MSLCRGCRILKQTLCSITDSFLAQLFGISRGNINSEFKITFCGFLFAFSPLKVFCFVSICLRARMFLDLLQSIFWRKSV